MGLPACQDGFAAVCSDGCKQCKLHCIQYPKECERPFCVCSKTVAWLCGPLMIPSLKQGELAWLCKVPTLGRSVCCSVIKYTGATTLPVQNVVVCNLQSCGGRANYVSQANVFSIVACTLCSCNPLIPSTTRSDRHMPDYIGGFAL